MFKIRLSHLGHYVLLTPLMVLLLTSVIGSKLKQEPTNTISPSKENVIFAGCNFTHESERGMPPFDAFDRESNTCDVPVKKTPQRFYYICPGISTPWTCPVEVLHQGQEVAMDTLVEQLAIRKIPHSTQQGVEVYTGILSYYNEVFTAICTCELPDGQLFIMKFQTTGFLSLKLIVPITIPILFILDYLCPW
ncbi:putative integral membrane protein [Babesia bovis T2Bo]|uniref:putative integral membrane protein n=1 Tax=Babesia bovis T2Bo TaxID=484906 RepID=UPI001D272CC0|nr:putative integral membrane protein [Babesia bovis T2Bo]KAG6439961.1 putative integral membrane protein [Babesia bovis T2Bo]